MPTIRHKSRAARTAFSVLVPLLALLAAFAVSPATGFAAEEPPQLAFEPGSYDFGLQSVEQGSNQTNLQLRNVGAEPAHIDSLELTGPGTEAFSIGYSNCWGGTNLQPNETCSVQIWFGPRDTTEYAVQVRVSAGPYAFTADLSGSGGRADLVPASNPVDFGVAAVGSAGTTREVQISNAGNMPGGVFIAVISGGAVGSFQLLDENCTNRRLFPAATCTVQVRFRPISEGAKTATLSLFGESNGGTQVALAGVGSAPEPAPEPAADLPAAAAGSATITTTKVTSVVHRRGKNRKQRYRRRHRRAAVHAGRVL